jgi:hypothetical protein
MVCLLMPRNRAAKKTSKLPPGAVAHAKLTVTTINGASSIHVHGVGGPHTGFVARKNGVEFTLPGATISNASPGIHYVAWDGDVFVLRPTLESILECGDLILIGQVEVPAQLAACGRPPLTPLACEAIDQLLYRVDERHWPTITAMRVKKYYPPDSPVPPPAPKQLLGAFRWYSSMVFGTEADQYDQFRKDGHYSTWLSSLAERTIARVLSAIKKLDESDPEALLLAYHGICNDEIEQDLKTMLGEIRSQYEQGIAPSQRKNVLSFTPTAGPPEAPQPSAPQQESVAEQLKRLQADCDLTAQEMADALRVDPRSIFRHLAGETRPRRTHLAAYEKLFSERLGKPITLKKVAQRHNNVVKRHKTS